METFELFCIISIPALAIVLYIYFNEGNVSGDECLAQRHKFACVIPVQSCPTWTLQ